MVDKKNPESEYKSLNREFDKVISGDEQAVKDNENLDDLRERLKKAGENVNQLYSYSRTHDNLIDQFNSLIRKNKAKTKDSMDRVKNELNTNIIDALETRDGNVLNDFYYGEKSRIQNYETYRQIFNLIPQLAQIVRTITDNVISPDDFSQMTIYSSLDEKVNLEKEVNEVQGNIDKLYEKYNIEGKIRAYVQDTIYLGDVFVAVLNYATEIKKLMTEHASDESLSEADMIKHVMKECVDRVQTLMEEAFVSIDKDILAENAKEIQEEFSLESKDANDAAQYINEKFLFIEDYKTVLLSEAANVASQENNTNVSKISGSIIKYLDPDKTIKIKVGDTVLGYYYLEKNTADNFGKSLSSSNPVYGSSFGAGNNTGINTVRRSGSNLDKAKDPLEFFTNLVMNNISKKINKKYLTSNPEFKDAIYTVLKKNDLNKGKKGEDPVIVTFIPAEECIHFMLGDDDYGHSIFENILFTAKLYLTSLVSTIMQRMIRAPDKRVFSVEVGLDEDHEGAVMSFVNDIKSKDITISSLTGDIDTALSQVSAFKDIYIPVIDGKRSVEVDSFPGADVSFDNDFLDYLLKSMIGGTGVPRALIDDAENVEFARTLAMQNGNFVRMICSYQHMFERKMTQFIQMLYRNEYIKEDEDNTFDLEDIKTRLSAPMYIKIQTLTDVLSQVEGIANTKINLFYNDDTMNPPPEDTDPFVVQRRVIERRLMKKEIFKKMVPQVDWDDMEEMFNRVKAEATQELLTQIAHSDPKDSQPTADDFDPTVPQQ